MGGGKGQLVMAVTLPKRLSRPPQGPMPAITIYSTEWCGWCDRAKALLRARGVEDWTEIDVEGLPGGWTELTERTGGTTVPQIFIADRHVGGYDDLAALDRTGRLETMLQNDG